MRKILLVDDDDLVRDIGCRLLESMGHKVLPAANGPEAMDILTRDATFDFLFSDVMMPGGMNGIELAKAAAEMYPHLRIILATGNIDHDWLKPERTSNLFTIVAKPYRKHHLAQLLAD